jgi:hypothetical protein
MAYKCLNTDEYWENTAEYTIGSFKVRAYHSYYQSEYRLKCVERAIHNIDNVHSSLSDTELQELESLVFERQLVQASIWIKASLVCRSSNDEEVFPQLQRMELIALAHAIRMHMLATRKTLHGGCNAEEAFSQDEVAQAMGVDTSQKNTKPHQKSIERWKKNQVQPDERGFADFMADLDLQELCMMDKKRFYREASRAIQAAVRFLKPPKMSCPLPSTSSQRKHKNRSEFLSGISGDINQKMSPSRASWKNGMHEDEVGEGDILSVETPRKTDGWKGKNKAKSLRSLASTGGKLHLS